MSKPVAPVRLNQEAIGLLLEILELPDPVLSHASAADHPEAEALFRNGLLVRGGHELVVSVRDDNEEFGASLVPSPEDGQLGYLSETGGWIGVKPATLDTYRADIPALIHAVLEKRAGGQRPIADVIPSLAWDLGLVRVPNRRRQLSIWLARRIAVSSVADQLQSELRARPAPNGRIVLTSTPRARLPVIGGANLVAIEDLLAGAVQLPISSASLGSRLDAPCPWPAGPLAVSADFRVISFYGEEFLLPKGVQQRRIVEHLFDRYMAGERWVSTDTMAASLGLDPSLRLRDAFRKSRLWNRVVTEKGGMAGFCFRDD